MFYKRLIRLHQIHLSKVLVMEVGDADQAVRVAEMAFEMNDTSFHRAPRVTNRVEIWRDAPDLDSGDDVVKEMAGEEIRIRGQGKIRAVVLFRERTDRHERYRERLNLHVLERLDEPEVVNVSEREWKKQRGVERNEAKEKRARIRAAMEKLLNKTPRLDKEKKGKEKRARERRPGSFGQS